MAPEYLSRLLRRRQRPSRGDDTIVLPAFTSTRATQPNYSSPSDNRSIRDTTAIDTFRAGTTPSPGHVDIPVPAPTQGFPPTGTGALTPALTDIQPTGPRCLEGNADAPVHPQAEEVPSAAPSSRPPYRLNPAKAKDHVDRIRRFRVLVMGRANAGKTTILQRVCNTTDQPEIFNGKGEKVNAAVVQGSQTRGYHNIEDELVFQSNPGFVFHDSCGFEAGSEEQFDIMKKFVMDRAKTTKLNQRIHAIWFCIPLNETHRMVMTAEQKFFDHCDTGHVPVILLATKSDTLELEVFEQLEDQGISADDAEVANLQEKILTKHIANLKAWLADTRFPPHDYLSLSGMQEQGAECAPLLTCTANALKQEGLQQLLISTQQSNLELCMEFAIMKTLKVYMKDQQHRIEPGPLAFYLSTWFPYNYYQYYGLGQGQDGQRYQYPDYQDGLGGGQDGQDGQYLCRDQQLQFLRDQYDRYRDAYLGPDYADYGDSVDVYLLATIDHPVQSLTIPKLSFTMQYSMQYIAEHGVGAILIFEYLYFLLQVQDARHNLQESLTLAVKEYQSSGIHVKVNQSIQDTFEKYGDNVDILCPIIANIAKENQLSKRLSRKD